MTNKPEFDWSSRSPEYGTSAVELPDGTLLVERSAALVEPGSRLAAALQREAVKRFAADVPPVAAESECIPDTLPAAVAVGCDNSIAAADAAESDNIVVAAVAAEQSAVEPRQDCSCCSYKAESACSN